MTQTKFVPEQWMETMVRAIKDYADAGFDAAVLDDTNQPVGLDVYEVVMEFPGPRIDEAKTMPLDKTLIHFEIDDIVSDVLGFGDNIAEDNYDAVTKTIRPQEGAVHYVNFDVGIWSSDRAGGTSARLRARQVLNKLFQGVMAHEALFSASSDGENGGVEIITFSGGSFTTERINDIDVYRQINTTLVVRVFSRTPLSDTYTDGVQTIEEIDQISHLTVLG